MNNQEYKPSGFRLLTPVIKNLLIINIILFFATITLSSTLRIDLVEYLGLHYLSATKFSPYQFITYMFMHGGMGHILFNMFALWMFGKVLEDVWGSKRFLIYYMVTGIGAGLIHYIVIYIELSPIINVIDSYINNPNPELAQFIEFINSGYFKPTSELVDYYNSTVVPKLNQLSNTKHNIAIQESVNFMNMYKTDLLNRPVVIGASGAVFGLLLAFGMMFPNSVIYLYFAIPIKAKYFVIIYGILELYQGMSNNPGDNVAHFAHLGGMLFGFFLIKYWQKKDRYY